MMIMGMQSMPAVKLCTRASAVGGCALVRPAQVHRTLSSYGRYKMKSRLNASSTSGDVNLVSQALTAKAATMAAVKKYLLSIGWDLAWVDGVTAEIMKRKLETSADQCKAVVEYLTGELKIPNRRVENMVSICKGILGKTPAELKETVDFIQSKGIDGDALHTFLSSNPVVLSYSVSPSKEYFEKGKARMTLVLVQGKDGAQVPSLVQWREGAAFSTAPMSPNLPSKST